MTLWTPRTCPSAETLAELREETLSNDTLQQLQNHLADCDSCRGLLEELALDSDKPAEASHASLAGDQDSTESDDALRDRLWRRIEAEYESLSAAPEEVDLRARLQKQHPIGKGGLGEVYCFEDTSLHRPVAVKVMRGEAAKSENARNRFDLECKITGELEHPGIAPVYGAGVAPDGRPLYAMRFVEGQTLAEKIRKFHESPQATCSRKDSSFVSLMQSFLRACETVAHAHRHGVIHRDLKPDNIVVKDDVTTVIDWGLAKRVRDEELEFDVEAENQEPRFTRHGSVLGSPSYMSPEQAAGNIEEVGKPTDIYGLGAVLYEILTAAPPHQPADNLAESLKQIAERPIPTAQARNNAAPSELSSICAKCLRTNPTDRFNNVEALIADIEHWLMDDVVYAHQYTAIESAKRWARGNASLIGVTASILLFCVLVGGAALVVVGQAWEDERNAKLAVLKAKSEAIWQRDRAFAAGESARIKLVQDSIESGQPMKWGSSVVSGEYLDGQLTLRQWRMATDVETGRIPASQTPILCAAIHPERGKIVFASADGSLAVCDAASGDNRQQIFSGKDRQALPRRKHYLEYESNAPECFVNVGWIDEQRIWAASLNGRVLTYNIGGAIAASTETPKTVLALPGLQAAAWSPVRKLLLTVDRTGTLRETDLNGQSLAQGRVAKTLNSNLQVYWWAAAQLWVATGSGKMEMFRPTTLQSAARIEAGADIWSLAVSPKHRSLAVAIENGLQTYTVQEFNGNLACFKTGEIKLDKSLHAISFSLDGERLFDIDEDGALEERSRHALNHVAWRQRRAHRLDTRFKNLLVKNTNLAFRRVATSVLEEQSGSLHTVGNDGAFAVWSRRRQSDVQVVLDANAGPNPMVLFDSVDPTHLWSLDEKGGLHLIDVDGDRILDSKNNAHPDASGIAQHAPSNAIVTSGGKSIRFWRQADGKLMAANRPTIRHDRALVSLAISPRGRWLAAVDINSALLVWDYATQQLVFKARLSSEEKRPLTGRLAFNADESLLAAFGANQTCVIFDCHADGRFRRVPDQPWLSHDGGVAMAWNPQRPRLLHVSDRSRFAFREFSAPEYETWVPDDAINGPAWVAIRSTPGKARVAALANDGRLVFLDANHGFIMSTFQSRLAAPTRIAFSSDSQYLAIANRSGELELWIASDETTKPPIASDESNQWNRRILIRPEMAEIAYESKGLGIDRQGRPCAIVVESKPSDYLLRGEGALLFLRLEGQKRLREQIELGDEFDRRVPPKASSLYVEGRDEPIIAFRRRTSGDTAYDGALHIAKRRGANRYAIETVVENRNMGFAPYLDIDSQGDVRSVFHFDHESHTLRQTHRNNGSWSTRILDRQGAGYALKGARGLGDTVLLKYQRLRFNGDPFPGKFIRLDPNTGEIKEKHSAQARDLAPSPKGAFVIIQDHSDGRREIVQQKDGDWIHVADLPKTPGRIRLAIDDEGKMWAVSYNNNHSSGRLLLWRRAGGRWQPSVIAKNLKLNLAFLEIRVKDDRPVVFWAGGEIQRRAALWVFTPK